MAYHMSHDNPLVAQVAAMVRLHKDGINSGDLQLRMGIAMSAIREALSICRKSGRLAYIATGQNARVWMSPETVPDMTAVTRVKQSVYFREYRARLMADGVIDKSGRMIDPPEWPVEQRFTNAATAPRVKTIAANSVWTWGQQA